MTHLGTTRVQHVIGITCTAGRELQAQICKYTRYSSQSIRKTAQQNSQSAPGLNCLAWLTGFGASAAWTTMDHAKIISCIQHDTLDRANTLDQVSTLRHADDHSSIRYTQRLLLMRSIIETSLERFLTARECWGKQDTLPIYHLRYTEEYLPKVNN